MKARIALGVCLLVACGDDGEDAVPQSGVPNVIVNTLSEEDATKLCQWMMPSLAEAIDRELICLRTALQGAQTKDACMATYNECVTDPSSAVQPTACDAAAVATLRAECNASVVPVEDCLLDAVQQTRKLKSSLSCDEVGKTYEAEPPSCKVISTGCIPN